MEAVASEFDGYIQDLDDFCLCGHSGALFGRTARIFNGNCGNERPNCPMQLTKYCGFIRRLFRAADHYDFRF